jgi:hypothetical protein
MTRLRATSSSWKNSAHSASRCNALQAAMRRELPYDPSGALGTAGHFRSVAAGGFRASETRADPESLPSFAQRSAGAAKEIKSLIESSVDKVETRSRLVRDAGTSTEDIASSM